MARPAGFPAHVRYRHSLSGFIAFIPASLFLFGIAAYSNYRQGSPWMWLWGTVAIIIPTLIIARLLWLERHGWWIRRALPTPTLPAHFSSVSWNATFDQSGITATQSDVLKSPPHTFSYAEIKRVDWEPGGRLQIIPTGKVPLLLHPANERTVQKMIAILSDRAPNIEWGGSLAAIREGWQPRI